MRWKLINSYFYITKLCRFLSSWYCKTYIYIRANNENHRLFFTNMLNANANMSPTIRICPSQWNNHSTQQFFSPRGNFAPV